LRNDSKDKHVNSSTELYLALPIRYYMYWCRLIKVLLKFYNLKCRMLELSDATLSSSDFPPNYKQNQSGVLT